MPTKQSRRFLSLIVILCMLIAMLPAVSAEGNIISVNSSDKNAVRDALSRANDGDIIEITGTGFINDTNSDGAPWVIDKAVTIRGAGTDPSLLIRSGGIILGADVSFENIELSLANNVRNAIMANGHTLTLTGVTRDTSARAIHLFCGGRTGGLAPASGSHGRIIIQNCPDLGNIYAGSISSDGKDNSSAIPATVTILPGSSSVGEIYACGALESYVDPDQMLNPDYEVDPPTPSAGSYPVSGAVTFNLYFTASAFVDGASGGAQNAAVAYTGSQYPNNGLTLKNISSLALTSGGMLTPTADSILPTDMSLSVPSGTTLGLTELGNLEIGSLSGGGALALGRQQTLTINGGVTGTTQVGVGSIFNGTSQQIPVENHTYICAPQSSQDAFALIPHNTQPGAQLERDANGNWMIPAKTVEEDKLQSLAPADVRVNSGEIEAIVPLHSVYSGNGLNLNELPLTIRVNGSAASYDANGKYYESAGLRLYVGNTGDGDELQIYDDNDPFNSPIPDGIYRIEITVPGTYTVSGADISASCTLTIGETSPAPVSIPVPLAKTGLKWTGTEQVGVEEGAGYTLTGHRGTNVGGYTAVAALEPGYQWSDGSMAQKTISWRIEKADGPAAPTGLSAAAPTAAGGADGKILGVTPAMEYAAKQDFSDAAGCTGTEITGLSSGTFFVRFRETATHEAGASVLVAVPDFNAPTVTAVSIISSNHKTAYQVGEALDVTGLTIKADYSDGSSRTVPVTAGMVSGFDSSQAAASQTLTISYGGQTASFRIQITQPEAPEPGHQHSWSASWSNSSTHHWHECTRAGCPIQQNSLKSGYDVHSAGAWVLDPAAAAAQNSIWHRSCSVCGYEMAKGIQVPAAKTGLKWTGAEQVGVEEGAGYTLTGHRGTNVGGYTAVAVPKPGYQWLDGSTSQKAISWRIEKADGPAAPTGLSAAAPTAAGGADGKILGVTPAMEYAAKQDFSDAAGCTGTEITGLSSGTFFVRFRETAEHEAGASAAVIVPEPGHQHSWSALWSASSTHHWHECTRAGCPIQQNSLKSGYDVHSAGAWVIDQEATAAQNGSRHRSCSVCGYEMVKEIIPATGGGSSGGDSSGGGTHSNAAASTVRNPDGSTTTTTVNRLTGTVTETTRTANGDTVKTTKHPNGSAETDVRLSNGTTASASTDARGKTSAQANLSPRAIEAARKDNAAVSLPVPALNAARAAGSASQVEILLPRNAGSVKVEIPVQNAGPCAAAVIVGSDGSETVVKKSAVTGDGITLTLDANAVVRIMDNSVAFSDVNASSWAKNAVDFVSAREIFHGIGGGMFSPDGSMTRGMMAVVLHNLEDGPRYTSASRFSDVAGNWYSDSVHWAVGQGIVSGYGDGTFGPNDSITREQLAVMLWRYAGSPAATNKELHFADSSQVSGYALEALCWASEHEIIHGVGGGQMAPQGLATRAQVAQMLMNYIQMSSGSEN